MANAPIRLAEANERIEQLFGELPRQIRNRRSLVGEEWAGPTVTVRDFVSRRFKGGTGDVMYRTYSASSHPSATVPFAYWNGDESGQGSVNPDIDGLERRTLSVLLAWSAAAARLYSYLGWAFQPFDDWFGLVMEQAQARQQLTAEQRGPDSAD